MSQTGAEALAKSDLTGSEFKVLMMLIARADFYNSIIVNQTSMAKELGMHRQHVNKAIRRMVRKGILVIGPKAGITPTYILSAEFGWKGEAKGHVIALNDERRRRSQEIPA